MGVLHPQELLRPGGWVPGDQVAQGCLHLLVHSLCLPIGLVMEPRGKAGGGSHQAAEHSPEGCSKLGTPVRNHMYREAVQAEDLEQDQLGSLLG